MITAVAQPRSAYGFKCFDADRAAQVVPPRPTEGDHLLGQEASDRPDPQKSPYEAAPGPTALVFVPGPEGWTQARDAAARWFRPVGSSAARHIRRSVLTPPTMPGGRGDLRSPRPPRLGPASRAGCNILAFPQRTPRGIFLPQRPPGHFSTPEIPGRLRRLPSRRRPGQRAPSLLLGPSDPPPYARNRIAWASRSRATPKE